MKILQTALAVVFNKNGQILMSKRYDPKTPRAHNKWQLPGGGLEIGETAIQAVRRETYEEANIKIRLLSRKPVVKIETIDMVKNIHIALLGFPAIYVSGTISSENDPESTVIDWFKISDIKYLKTQTGTKEIINECYKIWKSL